LASIALLSDKRRSAAVLSFGCGQVCPDTLGITTEQVNAFSHDNAHVNDLCATALALALGRPSQLPRSSGALYYIARVGMIDQLNSYRFDAFRADQFGGFGLEPGQLQDGDFRSIRHS
jgi:hypothetical protein